VDLFPPQKLDKCCATANGVRRQTFVSNCMAQIMIMKNVSGKFLERKYRRALTEGDAATIRQTRGDFVAFLQRQLAEAKREIAALRRLRANRPEAKL
jgi:hypothetical protein